MGLNCEMRKMRTHILPMKHKSAIRTRRSSELAGKQAKQASAGMCWQCQAHLELTSAQVHEACAHLKQQVEKAQTGTHLRISVSLLTTWKPVTKEAGKKIEMRVREWLEEVVRAKNHTSPVSRVGCMP